MGKAKDPPRFSLDKPYEQWKTEIRLWQLEQPDDNADTAKHAIRIALDMPEEGCNDIRARILATRRSPVSTQLKKDCRPPRVGL